MYTFEYFYSDENEDIRASFNACKAHAEALCMFYKSLLESTHINTESFKDKKLKHDAKHMIFLARELMYGIPVAESEKLSLDDIEILSWVKDFKLIINREVELLEVYIKDLSTDSPSRLNAAKHLVQLALQKKKHDMILSYAMIDHQKAKKLAGHQNSGKINAHKSTLSTNATAGFFQDALAELAQYKDELTDHYDQIVRVSFDNQVIRISSFDIGYLVKYLDKVKGKFESLKSVIQGMNKDELSESYNSYFEKIKKCANYESLMGSIASMSKVASNHPPALYNQFTIELFKIIYSLMIMSNNYEKAIPTLENRINHLEKLQLIERIEDKIEQLRAQAAISQAELKAIEAVIEERKPQVAVVRSVDNERVSPVEFEPRVSLDEADVVQETHKSNKEKISKQRRIQDENIRKVQKLDPDTLALFFKTPVPHFEMSHAEYYRFMSSIGANVNRSTGNGSVVKITLDPGSVLIATDAPVVSSGMAMHEQHNKGHKEKNLPSYVIKNTLKFFMRAGIYDHLFELYRKNTCKPTQNPVLKC